MNKSIRCLVLVALSFLATRASGSGVKHAHFNVPEMSRLDLPARTALSPKELGQVAVGFVDRFTPIVRPTGDYLSGTTRFEVTEPDFTMIGSLTDPESGCTVTLTPPLQARTVPFSWLTWGSPPDTESSTPRVLYTQGGTSITLSFTNCSPTTGGFEAEPNSFGLQSMTARFYSGSTELGFIRRDVTGAAGARLFAADTSSSFDRIVFSCFGDFALAQVRFAQGVHAILQGNVSDVATGNPIQGARVDVSDGVTRSQLTDAMGQYTFFLPPDTYDVTSSAFSYVSQTVQGVRLSDVTTLNFALASAPRHMVSGTVMTPDGTPAAGVQVAILSTPIRPTRTDVQGNYAFISVPEGTYTIEASGGCYGPQTTSVTVADDLVVNFVVPQRMDSFGYTCSEAAPFEWIPGDTLSPLVGYEATLTVPIGFAFNYYGIDYTSVTISTSISAHFGPPDGSSRHSCPAFPSPDSIAGLVGLAFDHGFVGRGRVPGGSGAIYTMIDGKPGSRFFVVEWRDIGYYGDGGTFTGEIIFWEGTNTITFQYDRTEGWGAGWRSAVGIQNVSRDDGLEYACNAPVLSAGKRVDFYHP